MSTLETLMIVFIIVTTAAVVIQMGVLVALYVGVKKSSARMETLAFQIHSRALPTLDMAQKMVEDSRPKVEAILTNLAASSTMLRQELERIDVSVADVVDRARLQVIRVDELVSHALDRVEDAGEMVHHSVVSPLRQAAGVLQGLTAGLATLFNKGPYARATRPVGTPKDEMFI
jgi:hypothetical protein